MLIRRLEFLVTAALAIGASVMAGQQPSGGPAKGWTPVKTIDFSSKHGILLRDEDGTLTPMDVPYFRVRQLAPGTWQILTDGDYIYLVEGDNEAIVIDTGYGAGNIREFCQSLTKKPIHSVVNTHHHFDHTANDGYFDRAYMSAETAKHATDGFQSFNGINFPKDFPKVIVGDGYKFQLGNRDLEVFDVPNHAAGSIALLDRRERILFSGDEVFGHAMRVGVSVAQFEKNMAKIAARRKDYDIVCGGFAIHNAAYVDGYLAAARHILEGSEGEAIAPQNRAPDQAGPQSFDPPGVTVYRRHFPHPGDGGGGGGRAPNPDLRKMGFAGVELTYDLRRIKE
jgi:glyoxylase-like metal-dependent hydrolase (beta-lactamase superfamily II)